MARRKSKHHRSPVKAIREFCLECMNDQVEEIARCTDPGCPLYHFRFGKNPYLKRTLTPEQKAAAAERMAKVRQEKKSGRRNKD